MSVPYLFSINDLKNYNSVGIKKCLGSSLCIFHPYHLTCTPDSFYAIIHDNRTNQCFLNHYICSPRDKLADEMVLESKIAYVSINDSSIHLEAYVIICLQQSLDMWTGLKLKEPKLKKERFTPRLSKIWPLSLDSSLNWKTN